MTTKAATKAPTKATKSSPPQAKQATPSKAKASEAKSATASKGRTEHPAAEGIPLPTDPSAVHLQEEQDALQQPGRVSKAVANQIDNDPGYSKDQLAHMREYWSHGDAIGEDLTSDDDGDPEAGSGD